MKNYPNRFRGLSYVNVNALRVSFLVGCILNGFLFLVFLSVIGLIIPDTPM